MPVDRDQDDIAIMHRIDEIYTRWPNYGHRRIRNTLQDEGIVISKKKDLPADAAYGIGRSMPRPEPEQA